MDRPRRSARVRKKRRIDDGATTRTEDSIAGVDEESQLQHNKATPQESNPKAFPWAKLPAELRNAIYDLVLVSDKSVEFHRSSKYPSEYLRLADYKFVPNLLLIDKATYNEAAPLLYRNTFRFVNSTALYLFISRLSPTTRSWITSIEWEEFCGSYSTKALSWLNQLPNLERLVLDPPVNYSEWVLAFQMLRESKWCRFFKRLGKLHGNPQAGADIVCLGGTSILSIAAMPDHGRLLHAPLKKLLESLYEDHTS